MAWSVLILIGINGLLAACVVLARRWVAVNVYHTPALAGYLRLFALILFLGALTTFFGQLLTGYKEVAKRTIITNFAGVLLTIVFTVILIFLGGGLWGYYFAQVVSAIVVLFLLIWTTYKLTPVAARFSLTRIDYPQREMFTFAAAAFAMDITGFLYGQTDKIILGFYLERSIGWSLCGGSYGGCFCSDRAAIGKPDIFPYDCRVACSRRLRASKPPISDLD